VHLADPIDACTSIKVPHYDEEKGLSETTIIVVKRGSCTFVAKATFA